MMSSHSKARSTRGTVRVPPACFPMLLQPFRAGILVGFHVHYDLSLPLNTMTHHLIACDVMACDDCRYFDRAAVYYHYSNWTPIDRACTAPPASQLHHRCVAPYFVPPLPFVRLCLCLCLWLWLCLTLLLCYANLLISASFRGVAHHALKAHTTRRRPLTTTMVRPGVYT